MNVELCDQEKDMASTKYQRIDMKRVVQIINSWDLKELHNNVVESEFCRTQHDIKVDDLSNFFILWLDSDIHLLDENVERSLIHLRQIVKRVNIFTEPDQCMKFIMKINDYRIFIIITDAFSDKILQRIHRMPHVDSIYIFSKNESNVNNEWKEKWTKVKGIFTQIDQINLALHQNIEQYDRDSVTINITSSNINQLDPLFVYSQLLKETLIEIPFDNEIAKKELVDFCRKKYSHDKKQLEYIEDFEEDYTKTSALKWYIKPCFVYQMLNYALRKQEVEVLIKMAFLLRDIHNQIKKMHSIMKSKTSLTVYRGQRLSNTDLRKMKQNINGLLSFNNFLSTSSCPKKAKEFAESVKFSPDRCTVGVIFVITIDPSISSSPFTSLEHISSLKEQEILFSMHTIFRINLVEINANHLWQVDLTLTSNDDQELKQLTEYIRKDIHNENSWHRLAVLLIQIGHFNTAEELYRLLLKKTSVEDERELSYLYHQLGYVQYERGAFNEALMFSNKALDLRRKLYPSNHPVVADSYCVIGTIHEAIGLFDQARIHYQKTLEIREQSLDHNHPDLAIAYDKTALVYLQLGEFEKALEIYQNTLEIRQKSLPPVHPDLATIYDKIGSVYSYLNKSYDALQIYKKAFEIRERSLPPNHPDFIKSYKHMASALINTCEYDQLMILYQKSLEIAQICYPSNHPEIATIYRHIGSVHYGHGEYLKALEFEQKALEILEMSLPSNNLSFANIYSSIASTYMEMKEYLQALNFYQRALEIIQTILAPNHTYLAITLNYIGIIYAQMKQYPKAIEFYQRSLDVIQKYVTPDANFIKGIYKNLVTEYNSMEEDKRTSDIQTGSFKVKQKSYSLNDLATLSVDEIIVRISNNTEGSLIKIKQKSFSSTGLNLMTTDRSISSIVHNMEEHQRILKLHQRSIEIVGKSLSPYDSRLAPDFDNIASVFKHLGDYSSALKLYERSLAIRECHYHPKDFKIIANLENIASIHNIMRGH